MAPIPARSLSQCRSALTGVKRIASVNHAWYMPRAFANFDAMGLAVVHAPKGFSRSSVDVLTIPPSISAFSVIGRALLEWLGIITNRFGKI